MIKDLLQNKNDKEKANIKGQEIAKIDFRGEYISTQYGVRIDIQSIKAIEGGVEIMARAWKGTEQLGFGKDGAVEIERFVIINPPVLVDDPNGTVIREWIDEDTGELKQRKLREDPAETIRQVLSHTITLVGKEDTNIVKGKVGNTTLTAFPAAGANSPVDGRTARFDNVELWDSIHDGAGDFSSVDAATGAVFGLIRTGGTTDRWNQFIRGIFGFDTSSIGTDTVDSATFSLFGTAKFSDFDGNQRAFVDRNVPASSNNLVNNDFNLANWDGVRQSDTDILTQNWNTSAYNDMTLNSTGKGNVNTSGLSWYGIRISGDFNDVEPTWASNSLSRVEGYYADRAGTSEDPKLVVEHTAPVVTAVTPPTFIIFE